MISENAIELEAVAVVFYSQQDETAFFEWLKRIPCVLDVFGVGRAIKIRVDRDLVDEESIRELLSLHRRYDVSMRQLVVFDTPAFTNWFRDSRSYWYRSVFSEKR